MNRLEPVSVGDEVLKEHLNVLMTLSSRSKGMFGFFSTFVPCKFLIIYGEENVEKRLFDIEARRFAVNENGK